MIFTDILVRFKFIFCSKLMKTADTIIITIVFRCDSPQQKGQFFIAYCISSNKRPWCLLNFETVGCDACQREALILKLAK